MGGGRLGAGRGSLAAPPPYIKTAVRARRGSDRALSRLGACVWRRSAARGHAELREAVGVSDGPRGGTSRRPARCHGGGAPPPRRPPRPLPPAAHLSRRLRPPLLAPGAGTRSGGRNRRERRHLRVARAAAPRPPGPLARSRGPGAARPTPAGAEVGVAAGRGPGGAPWRSGSAFPALALARAAAGGNDGRGPAAAPLTCGVRRGGRGRERKRWRGRSPLRAGPAGRAGAARGQRRPRPRSRKPRRHAVRLP